MDEIKKFINTHFDEIKMKDNKIKTPEEAYTILLQTSLFHIKDNPNIFDWKRYINTYPDLKKALHDCHDASWHYLNYGIRERRKVYVLNSDEPYEHQFNWKDYITINQNLRFIMSDIDAFQHYIEQGHFQNRQTTIKEQTIINDRIEITENPTINKQWLQLLARYVHSILYSINSVLVCSHSNLAYTAGDTIMLSNWINKFMSEGNNVTILSKYHVPKEFLVNLQYNNYHIQTLNTDYNIINYIDNNEENFKMMFIRNHEILDMLQNKPYLNKITFYGLDVHIDGLSKMNNQFQKVVTQSEELKSKYVKSGIVDSKIEVQEPFVFKYDFDIPPRNDKEIRLIYCGTLRDEENILEIIEEFKKIHAKRPEVVLKIIYGKIFNSSNDFTTKVNNYIQQGVIGITFKHNLSHHDSCYEIATSDIGICWRKNGWGENGEVSTKVKEYELYKKPCLFFIPEYNKLFYRTLMELKECNPTMIEFYNEIIHIYKENVQLIPYVLHNAMPYDNGGYAVRGHNIMNTFNNMYSDKQYIGVHKFSYPYKLYNMSSVKNYVNKINNVNYITLPFVAGINYNRILLFLTGLFNIKTYHMASSFSNAEPIIEFCNNRNLRSIYEVRGMWQLTGISRILYYKNNIQDKYLKKLQNMYSVDKYKNVFNQEINCIKNSTNVLYITDELYHYCQNNLNSIKISDTFELDIILGKNQKNIPKIFYNCSNHNNFENISLYKPINIKQINKNNPFIIGYTGSIVYYEGIYQAVIAIEELIKETNLNIEVHILGNMKPVCIEEEKIGISHYRSIGEKSFVKLINKVPHNEVVNIQKKFHLYMIPRLDLPVTNIVSPLKPFEPMSLKIPLIMSDCLCLNNISKNGKNCAIFKKNNFKDFKEKVLQIVINGYDEEVLENAYKFVKNERSWKNMIKHVGLYDLV